jgi:glycosyltransferase involved in cell wall biosynthesis
MKLIVDGVFFQLASTGIARVWSSILPRLARVPDLEIVLLDRGGCPTFAGIHTIDFPAYKMHANTAADSLLIDRFCRELDANVFVSTYYTTPVTVCSVLMVYDMIPEVMGFDLSQRAWQEKAIAIGFASYFACISENTRSDLRRFYPGTQDRSIVTHCGVDRDVFHPRNQKQVETFKRDFDISKAYFVLVGSREQHLGYKNGDLLFKAVQKVRDVELEILCIGGELHLNPDILASLPANVSARRIDLTDDQLACAYTGAEALVFPSLYEGFGMPVIEAMACGCPVITTKGGALGEISGDAAIFISGRDEDELRRAMESVRAPTKRSYLVEEGGRQADRYDWGAMALGLHDLLKKASVESKTKKFKAFLKDWQKLRTIQADVDTG